MPPQRQKPDLCSLYQTYVRYVEHGDVATSYADFMPGLEGPVLAVLAGTTRGLTGRQIQRLATRGGVSGVAATLERLVNSGLVVAEPAGRAILYRANRDHLAWPVVEAAVGLRASFLRQLADAIARWRLRPRQATLFGSAARADGSTGSDIDLLLVRDGPSSDAWERQVDSLSSQIWAWTGNHAQIVDLDAGAWQRMVVESDPFAASIQADGIDLLASTWRGDQHVGATTLLSDVTLPRRQ